MSQILNTPLRYNHLNVFLLAFVLLLCSKSGMAQGRCNFESMVNENMPLLENYKIIKSFPVETNKQTDKVEYSYVLNRDTRYRMVVVDNGKEGERMVVTVKDKDKKVLVTNKERGKKVYLKQMDFVCPATGVYYFEAKFEDDHKDCGLNILGFQK